MNGPYYELTQNDIPYPISATLFDANGVAVDLSAITNISFFMKSKTTGQLTLTGTSSVVDAPSGKVQYAWAANDTKIVERYSAEFQVTFTDGKIISFPTDPKILIEITPQIG